MTKGEAVQAMLDLSPVDFEDAMATLLDGASAEQRTAFLAQLTERES